MPERFRHVWQQFDAYALFGAGLGTVASALSGASQFDIPAIMSGIGIFIYACSRSFRSWSEGYKNMQEARFIAKGFSKEYIDYMQSYVCFGSKNCPVRVLEPPEDD